MIVHLVDGTYELFRHFYGLRRFNKGKDRPFGAVIGVLQTLLQMIEQRATHVGVATDHIIESFRNRIWPDYKTSEGMDPELIEEAGECGLRPLAILLGAARAAGLSSKVLSYEGPFGVGYPVVAFTSDAVGCDIQDLGRRAIETYLRSRQLIDPPQPIPAALQEPSALFVTLRKGRELRGCVGSLRPTEPTAAHELIRYAVAAAVRDPRFEPVRLDELRHLSIKVQLLEPAETVTE